jgi:NAD(P)H dehydrogenase (quinone)
MTGSASLQGGQETTIITMLTPMVHHGAIFVPLGYADASMFDLTPEAGSRGGGPWGSGYYSGNGPQARGVSTAEAALARVHGKTFAETVKVIKAGRAALAAAKSE